MCYICGCSYFTIDDLVWYKYQCTQCDLVYQSTGKISFCPRCRSQDVKEVLKGSGKDKTGSTKKTSKKRK